MRIKSMFLMVIAAIMCMGAVASTPVRANDGVVEVGRDLISVEANKVLDSLILVDSISAGGNMLHYVFNGQKRTNVGMWAFYLATYDYENVPMSVVDAGLHELGVVDKPSWAQAVFVDEPNQTSTGDRGTSANLFYTPGMDVSYGPGILYYALQVYDTSKGADAAELYWVRGKIDYRECAYNGKYGEPHMTMTCKGVIRNNTYSYNRYREEGDVYRSWADEWNEDLMGDLGDLETEIEAWGGDDETAMEILKELDRVGYVAEDASDTDVILIEVERLRALFKDKEQQFKQQEEDDQKKEEGGNQKPSGSSGSSGWIGGSSAVVGGDLISGADEDTSVKENSGSLTEVDKSIVQVEKNEAKVAAVVKDEDDLDESDNDNQVHIEDDIVEVPALSESSEVEVEEEGIFSKIWWIILLILLIIGATIWWGRERYGRRKV